MKLLKITKVCLLWIAFSLSDCFFSKAESAQIVTLPHFDQKYSIVMFHGLGGDPVSLQNEFSQKIKSENLDQVVDVNVLKYEDIGLSEIYKRAFCLQIIQATGCVIDENIKQDYLRDMRDCIQENIGLLKEKIGRPLENTFFIGTSFGGLVSSICVDILKKQNQSQVQALLVTQSPLAGFLNDLDQQDQQEQFLLPAFIFNEVGRNDPIFKDAEKQTQQIFAQLHSRIPAEMKDRYFYHIHEEGHNISPAFFDALKFVIATGEDVKNLVTYLTQNHDVVDLILPVLNKISNNVEKEHFINFVLSQSDMIRSLIPVYFSFMNEPHEKIVQKLKEQNLNQQAIEDAFKFLSQNGEIRDTLIDFFQMVFAHPKRNEFFDFVFNNKNLFGKILEGVKKTKINNLDDLLNTFRL